MQVQNTLAGYVEPAHVNNFQFELERKTFHSYGFAHDPSQDNPGNKMITNQEDGLNDKFEKKTVFEAVKERPKDKRKRDKNDDPTDIEGKIGTLICTKLKRSELVFLVVWVKYLKPINFGIAICYP